LGELVFVGLGLSDEKDVSLRGLEEMKDAGSIFVELYTSLMPKLSVERLEDLVGKKLKAVSRRDLEEDGGKSILRESERGKAVLLVPGDPLIATTHIDLRVRAEKAGIKTSVVHGASIVSAAIGLSGLQNYKFGRSVTIPFPEGDTVSETPYMVIVENRKRGLHTLCFLDIRAEEKRYMTIRDGLEALRSVERLKKKKVVVSDTLVVGIARAGSKDFIVKAGYLKEVITHEFGTPPHCLVFPGRLHFMEADALITLAEAPEEIKKSV